MSNLNAVCSTWHLWPKAYQGLCWVSLTFRPCQRKMWSTLLRDELLSISHRGRALPIPAAAPVPRSSGQKRPILLFPRILCRQAHSFPTSPAGCPEGNQKELAIKLVGRVGLHHCLNESVTVAPVQERELIARDTALEWELLRKR